MAGITKQSAILEISGFARTCSSCQHSVEGCIAGDAVGSTRGTRQARVGAGRTLLNRCRCGVVPRHADTGRSTEQSERRRTARKAIG